MTPSDSAGRRTALVAAVCLLGDSALYAAFVATDASLLKAKVYAVVIAQFCQMRFGNRIFNIVLTNDALPSVVVPENVKHCGGRDVDEYWDCIIKPHR